jgi:RNA polymerase sigma-70 factor (ECF subfamily)
MTHTNSDAASVVTNSPVHTSLVAAEPFDRAALEVLYKKLERKLYNVVFRWVWNEADARDVVQEAFVRLWTKRDSIRADTVEAFAYRIAVNLAANRRRGRKLWGFVSLEGLRVEAPTHDDTTRKVRRAVDALPERLRQVMVLGEFSGMTAKEIGVVLNIPEGTVSSRRHHAIGLLRASLGDLMKEDSHETSKRIS